MTGTNRFRAAAALAALVGFTACSDKATEPDLADNTQIEADLAVSSGDAIATEVQNLLGNEQFAGLPGVATSAVRRFGAPQDFVVSRSRTFYDAQGGAQAQFDPVTTASVRVQVTIEGTASRDSFTASVSRTRDLTISGLAGQETSRTHDGLGTSHDTLAFTGAEVTRRSVESALDSVVAVVFDLPRAANPWPVSGRIVRQVEGTVTVTRGENSGTRSYSRRIEVVFPADAQGNVTLHVGDRTCQLNLVTRRVTGCTGG